MTIKLADDGHCFACGPKNPIGLKLHFSYDGKKMKTTFLPRKEHQGYKDIVHGGIIATILDEIMVKLAIRINKPAVTAQMDIRLKQPLKVGDELTVTAEITKEAKKLLEASAVAVRTDKTLIADASGKLIKINTSE